MLDPYAPVCTILRNSQKRFSPAITAAYIRHQRRSKPSTSHTRTHTYTNTDTMFEIYIFIATDRTTLQKHTHAYTMACTNAYKMHTIRRRQNKKHRNCSRSIIVQVTVVIDHGHIWSRALVQNIHSPSRSVARWKDIRCTHIGPPANRGGVVNRGENKQTVQNLLGCVRRPVRF